MPTILSSETRLGSNTRTVTATFTSYTPAAGDLVLIFAHCPEDTATPGVTAPSGWSTVSQVGNTGGSCSALSHIVDSSEAIGGITTFTATNYFDSSKNWRSVACVVRGANPSDLIDGIGTGGNPAATTSHSIAAISGASLVSGSLPIAAVAAGATANYTGAPGGWTLVVASSSGSGIGMWVRDTTTTAGADVAAAAVTSSASVSYTAISVAVTAAPTSDSNDFFAFF